jgi:hypothetical protein
VNLPDNGKELEGRPKDAGQTGKQKDPHPSGLLEVIENLGTQLFASLPDRIQHPPEWIDHDITAFCPDGGHPFFQPAALPKRLARKSASAQKTRWSKLFPRTKP